jgi:hypothetical protein
MHAGSAGNDWHANLVWDILSKLSTAWWCSSANSLDPLHDSLPLSRKAYENYSVVSDGTRS